MFGAEMAKLIAAGIPADVAAPGTEMPDGDLLDAHGRSTTLAVARDGKPAVVVFYRGEWCPTATWRCGHTRTSWSPNSAIVV